MVQGNGGLRQIAVYGKGGIGKSSIASNVSVALAELGLKVLQIGCSPKGDSTALLNGGRLVQPTILDKLRSRDGTDLASLLRSCFIEGYKGVVCAESGGPEPATGCAGKGITSALDLLRKLRIIESLAAQVVLYDVLGDVVCGGFAQPMRQGFATEVYIVTSGEVMAIYAANNICSAIETFARSKQSAVRVGGIIDNMRGVEKEEELVEEFCRRIGVRCMGHVPRSRVVQEAEAAKGTVMEKVPSSQQAECYRELATKLLENTERSIPTPMEFEDLLLLVREYQEV